MALTMSVLNKTNSFTLLRLRS
uniref:Uncharacterized protein n=1 Tax=Anguilla anguilla TaxID=7936 RepID=A0A0E9VBN9_ANGAN